MYIDRVPLWYQHLAEAGAQEKLHESVKLEVVGAGGSIASANQLSETPLQVGKQMLFFQCFEIYQFAMCKKRSCNISTALIAKFAEQELCYDNTVVIS